MINIDFIKKNVTAIIVIYDSTYEVINCLNQLSNLNIIIVDNGKCEFKIKKKILELKNVKYLRPKRNLGFGRANNFAFKLVKTKYTLLINSDIKTSLEDIVNLVKMMIKFPKTGITVPILTDEKKVNNDNIEVLPEISSKFLNKNLSKGNFKNNLLQGDTCIYFCWGAIMLLNNEIIQKTKLFNKKYFLYWEDYDLCRKLYFNKIPIIKVFNSRAHHMKHKSVKKNIHNQFIMDFYHVYSSYLYFDLKKNNKILIKRLIIYFFRTLSYMLIFNLKGIIKNIARFAAIIKYKFLN